MRLVPPSMANEEDDPVVQEVTAVARALPGLPGSSARVQRCRKRGWGSSIALAGHQLVF